MFNLRALMIFIPIILLQGKIVVESKGSRVCSKIQKTKPPALAGAGGELGEFF
jgi:hypothetical protein